VKKLDKQNDYQEIGTEIKFFLRRHQVNAKLVRAHIGWASLMIMCSTLTEVACSRSTVLQADSRADVSDKLIADSVYHTNLGVARIRWRDFEGAKDESRLAISLNPKNSAAFTNLDDVCMTFIPSVLPNSFWLTNARGFFRLCAHKTGLYQARNIPRLGSLPLPDPTIPID
jgi:hypothetical protein